MNEIAPGPLRPTPAPPAPGGMPAGAILPRTLELPRIAGDFQPDALAIETRAPPRATRATLYVIAALIVSAVAWAAWSEVDRIVVAEGRLVTTTPNLVVQPLEVSMIRSIAVAPGDVVRAGDTLATLDPTFAAADAAQLAARLASRNAQLARLEAEIAGAEYRAPPGAAEEERLQEAAFLQRRAWRGARLRDLEERSARATAAIATAERDGESLVGRLEVLRELEAMRTQLLASQTGSRVALLEVRNQRLDLEGRAENLRLRAVELRHELEATRAERDAFLEEQRRTAFEELVRLRDERDAIAEELAKAAMRRRISVLTAPADAVVLQVADRSVGSVLREAEPLVTLVPLNVPLEAELVVEARDIGRVALDQPVRIKLDAWPYQEHGTLSGSLRTISEGVFTREGEQRAGAIYRARARIEAAELRGVPASFRVIPGMTVTGEIKAGRRNVLSYFLHPFLRGLDEGLREP